MPLSVNMDRSLGQAKGQCIVEVPAVALDEPGGNPHPPLAAAMRQVPQSRPVRSLGAGAEVGKQTVACVEHLRQNRELGPRPVGLAQEIVGDLKVGGSLQQLGSASAPRRPRSSLGHHSRPGRGRDPRPTGGHQRSCLAWPRLPSTRTEPGRDKPSGSSAQNPARVNRSRTSRAEACRTSPSTAATQTS